MQGRAWEPQPEAALARVGLVSKAVVGMPGTADNCARLFQFLPK